MILELFIYDALYLNTFGGSFRRGLGLICWVLVRGFEVAGMCSCIWIEQMVCISYSFYLFSSVNELTTMKGDQGL